MADINPEEQYNLIREHELVTEHDGDNVVHHRPGQAGTMQIWRQKSLIDKGEYMPGAVQEETRTKALRVVKWRPPLSYNESEILITTKNRPDLFIEFLGWYRASSGIYLAMEYIRHGNLEEYLRDFSPHSKPNPREIITQLLDGLRYMHELNIPHGDLDPTKVLISSRIPFCVKLTYFENCGYTQDSQHRAQDYKAPEKLINPTLSTGRSGSADIWALGCILFQILRWEGTPNIYQQPCQSTDFISLRYMDLGRLSSLGIRMDCLIEDLLPPNLSIKTIEFLKGLLAVNPLSRFSAAEALEHEWINLEKYKLRVSVPRPDIVVHIQSTWRVVKGVAQGVMGMVWLEEEENTEKLRVVKKVHTNIYTTQRMRYEQELEVLVKLKEHRNNFIQFFGWYEHGGYVFFAMEYAEHGDLEKYLENYGQEAKMGVVEIARQVLQGFVTLQQNNLDHDYFSPKNVLVTCGWPIHVKLLLANFGSIQVRTHPWMAPELLDLLPPEVNPNPLSIYAANMWALGCLIYRILTSKELFTISDVTPPDLEPTPRLDTIALKRFCHGEISLTSLFLQLSPKSEKWTCFLQGILVADPNSRKSAKVALDSGLFRAAKAVNPYKWKATFLKDDTVMHRTDSSESIWKEIKRISGGGMGSVWLMNEVIAGKTIPENRIAVKKLSRDFCVDHKIDFTRELHALIVVRDYKDLFVQFLGWYEDRNFIFLAMEYIENGDLAGYLKEYGLDAKLNGEEISTQLLEGLVFLHERHICHRDLKPQNVLVASSKPIRIKLADFGLAKSTQESNLRTQCGTEGYKAPELIVGLLPQHLRSRGDSPYTSAVDVWSLGCLVYKILTFEIPFLENTELGSETGCKRFSEPLEYQDWDLLKGFCRGEKVFPRGSLQKVGVCQMGIDFVEKMLVPDPELRISAMEALKSPWLCNASQRMSLPVTIPQIIRSQLSTLGIQISQRTADCLMRKIQEPCNEEPKGYLPSTILQCLRELQHNASLAGLTLLLRVLLKICIIHSSDGLTVTTWSVDTPGLDSVAEPIKTSYDGISILQAAIRSKNIETVEFLLSAGYDVNEVLAGVGSQTALQEAAAAGNIKIVLLLVSRGADCNAPPSKERGRTALQAAAETGHAEVVRLLLANGALINAKACSVQGRTALQASTEAGYLEVVRFLLDNGADVNSKPCYMEGRTALQAAAGSGHLEVTKLLLNRGADINATPCEVCGRTALQAASENGYFEIARLLLETNADPNAQPSPEDGKTALHAAAENGHLELVTLLLEFGADPSFAGGVAEKDASKNGHEAVAQLLGNI